MRLRFVRPKMMINLVAGILGLLFDQFEGNQTSEMSAHEDSDSPVDDLTEINGIGPAFARRLNEGGVISFRDLASMTAEEVRERAKLSEWQGDPEDWIGQAQSLLAR